MRCGGAGGGVELESGRAGAEEAAALAFGRAERGTRGGSDIGVGGAESPRGGGIGLRRSAGAVEERWSNRGGSEGVAEPGVSQYGAAGRA